MSAPPSKQLDQFVIRLPDGMRERIKVAADTNSRSMNSEIIATLEEKYPPPEPAFDIRQALINLFTGAIEKHDPPVEIAEHLAAYRNRLLELPDDEATTLAYAIARDLVEIARKEGVVPETEDKPAKHSATPKHRVRRINTVRGTPVKKKT